MVDVFGIEDAPLVASNFPAVVDVAEIECWKVDAALRAEKAVDFTLALELG